jgi:eukaryotic-like serine/threonine-protein kinase
MSTQADADRNVLFGTLAVQMGFVTRDDLAAVTAEWERDTSRSLGDVLCERKALADDERRLLDAMVAKHLVRQGDDPARSLTAVSPDPSVREALSQATDPMGGTHLGPRPVPGPAAAAVTNVDVYATRAATAAGAPSTAAGPTVRDGRFRVIRPHAKGGLGEVFVARDGELNREVALKEIQDRHADHPESRTRFLLEAEITGALEHPGIVPVYGLGAYPDGRPFYAMRFIRGDSLHDAIKQFHAAEGPARDPGERALALRGLLRRFIDVCHAVAYAHSRGVIHRDLKPGNVMLGHYGETLVVDWGLAKPLSAANVPEYVPLSVEGPVKPLSMGESAPTFAGMAIGTPQYMSPEQAAGRIDELGPASDVYSLGATLYCLLVGAPPLEGVGIEELLVRAQRADAPPARDVNPTVPPALSAVCQKAMALMPPDRYPTAAALADDVERWLADEPTSAWAEPWAIRARRWVGRHRTGVTTAAGAVVVAGICLGLATVLLTAANRRERAAKQEASRQRDAAAENYRLARRAVDRYHTEVSEDVLLNEPGMEPLRRRLLESAREFYAQFVDRRADDPEVKAELGRALFRLAQITADVEGPAKGIDLHQQALAVFNELPDDPDLLADRAASLHHLGRLQRATDRFKGARQSYDDALALWLRLEGADPDNDRYRAEEARTRLGLGNLEQDLRRLAPAKAQYDRVLAIRSALAEKDPGRADYARDLATTRHNLAVLQTYTGPPDQAEANFNLARAAQEKLAAGAPTVTQFQADLARTHLNLGNFFAQREQTERAAAEYQASADGWARLADKHPAVVRFAAGQGKALLSMCKVRRAARQDGPAEEALTAAQDVYRRLGATAGLLPQDKADVAAGYRQIASLDGSAGRLDAARAAYQKALDLLGPLAAGPNAPPEYVAELARTLHNLGFLERVAKNTAAADAAYRMAQTLWDGLIKAYPENPDYAAGWAATRRALTDPGAAGGTAIG